MSAAGLKAYNPTTPGLRGRIIEMRDGLWKGRPHKALTVGLRKRGGRNHQGRITVRHKGGGHKRLYRKVDFKQRAQEGEGAGEVVRIEYDPNRSARIALVKYAPGTEGAKERFAYILAPRNIGEGATIETRASLAGLTTLPAGMRAPLHEMLPGTAVHNIEIHPGAGGQLVRSAGTSATVIKRGDPTSYAIVRLPSGEQRNVLSRCYATIGTVSNPMHSKRKLGKAGAKRWMGIRPTVRGMAMNPVDHPHGGGRGSVKGRISQSPWGVPSKGKRTRNNPRTDQYIRLSRHRAKLGGQ